MCAERTKAIYTNFYICGKGKSETVLVSRLLFPCCYWLVATGGSGEGRIGSFETKLENVLRGLEEEEEEEGVEMHSHSSFISGLVISAFSKSICFGTNDCKFSVESFLSFKSGVLFQNCKIKPPEAWK